MDITFEDYRLQQIPFVVVQRLDLVIYNVMQRPMAIFIYSDWSEVDKYSTHGHGQLPGGSWKNNMWNIKEAPL